MAKRPLRTVSFFLILSLVSCASGARRKETISERKPEPQDVAASTDARASGPMVAPSAGAAAGANPAETAEYQEIFALYNGGEYEALLEKSAAFEKHHPSSPQLPSVLNLRGLGYLLSKRPQQAIPVFQRAVQLSAANRGFSQYVLYNLAKAQYDAGFLEESARSAGQIAPETLDRDNRLKLHYLKARTYLRRSMPLESARESLTAAKLLSDLQIEESRDTRNAFVAVLDAALKQVTSPEQLGTLYREFETSALADSILFRLGSAEMSAGNAGQGEAHLRALMTQFPQSRYYADTVELLKSTQAQVPVEPNSVGVLLPMKGKFAKFGLKNRQAIELAFGIFNQKSPDTKLTLVVEDSGEEPEQTIRALNRLVTKHHVVAVIGPLLSKGIDQITQRATELGVPLVSLARYPGIASDFIFPAGLTLRLQASEIARFATDRLGFSKFAIAYPKDKVGEESMQDFWDAVEQDKGSVVGAQSYAPGETDFRSVVDRLSGLAYPDSRQRELDELAKQRDDLKIKKRNRKSEQYFALKPIVDYEAVFIPDEPKTAGQLLPTFAYRDVDKVKFLGTSAWSSPELATRAQANSENAYFVDAFDPQSDSKLVQQFIQEFRETYSQEPNSMDAMAYDAARIVASVISPDSKLGRSDIRERLKGIRSFPGVTGKISYKDGEFVRNLAVFTFRQGKIARAE